jgi:hypothetical protein
MRHVRKVSRCPGKADTPPVDVQFIIDVLTALLTKKQAAAS